MSKILIVGANGTIGTSIANEFTKRKINFDGTFSSKNHVGYYHLNLADDLSEFDFSNYSNVIICAGIAGKSVDENPDFARKINIDGTIQLVNRVHEFGGKITFISTSAVFSANQQSANENFIPNPMTLYGQQKLEIEKYLLSPKLINFKPTIIRPTKVLSGKKGLIKSWLDEKTISANRAVTLSPISDKFLANLIADILNQNQNGIFHVSGSQILDYSEFAEQLILKSKISLKDKKVFEDFSQLPDSATHLETIRKRHILKSLQSLDEFFDDTLFE